MKLQFFIIMDIKEQQSRDSIRIVWNVMPSNRSLQAKTAIPQALHYTPLQQRQEAFINQSPIKCVNCDAYMNPYNRINLTKAEFKCCICKQNNKIPTNYLKELPQYPPETTLNYSSFVTTQRCPFDQQSLGFLFLIDICLDQNELDAVKLSILDLVGNLTDENFVGLITFNKYVSIFDLASSPAKVHSFSPQLQYEVSDLMKMLQINHKQNKSKTNRFIHNLGECRSEFQRRVKQLHKIKQPSYKAQRQARATGQALNLALSILQLSPIFSKIVFFCGGPCTIGAGKIIEQDFKSQMRSIIEPTPKLSLRARQFYQNLSVRAKGKQICIDSFIFSVQETGFAQMSQLLASTGGLVVQHQQFNSNIFKQSFRKAYQGLSDFPPLETAVFSSITVNSSQEIVFSNNFVNKIEAKQRSSVINIGGLDENRTITIMYDLAELSTQSEAYYIQIKTIYQYPQNLSIKFERVTTIRRLFGNFIGDIMNGFDQEAALALLAKLSIRKSLQMPANDVRQWLDNTLCKWAATFGEYRSGQPESFKLANHIRLFPQFVYNIRRNSIVRRSGLSLDEFVYICSIVMNQSVENIVLIIQPALLQYTPEHTTMTPIPLDEKYMKSDSVLLLDSFFNVVQWRGNGINSLIENEDHDHAYLSAIIKNVSSDVETIKCDRYPVPQYYLTRPAHSKERFIKSRLNAREQDQAQSNLSDEVDINHFTEKLIQLVVNKKM